MNLDALINTLISTQGSAQNTTKAGDTSIDDIELSNVTKSPILFENIFTLPQTITVKPEESESVIDIEKFLKFVNETTPELGSEDIQAISINDIPDELKTTFVALQNYFSNQANQTAQPIEDINPSKPVVIEVLPVKKDIVEVPTEQVASKNNPEQTSKTNTANNIINTILLETEEPLPKEPIAVKVTYESVNKIETPSQKIMDSEVVKLSSAITDKNETFGNEISSLADKNETEVSEIEVKQSSSKTYKNEQTKQLKSTEGPLNIGNEEKVSAPKTTLPTIPVMQSKADDTDRIKPTTKLTKKIAPSIEPTKELTETLTTKQTVSDKLLHLKTEDFKPINNSIKFDAIEQKDTRPAEQVLDKIRSATQDMKLIIDKKETITIELKPEHLGKVEIKMEVNKHGHVHTVITANRLEAIEHLQRDVKILHQGFMDAGLKSDENSMSFNLRDQNQHNQQRKTSNTNIRKISEVQPLPFEVPVEITDISKQVDIRA